MLFYQLFILLDGFQFSVNADGVSAFVLSPFSFLPNTIFVFTWGIWLLPSKAFSGWIPVLVVVQWEVRQRGQVLLVLQTGARSVVFAGLVRVGCQRL